MQPGLDKHYPWNLHRQENADPILEILQIVDEKGAETAEAMKSNNASDLGERDEKAELLARVQPFDLFDERWLRVVSGLMVAETYKETENIYRAGDISSAAYVVVEGEVAIFSDTIGEPVQLLARVKRGGTFGEIGVLDRRRRTASARASQNSKVLRLEGCDLQRLGRANPLFGLKLAQRALLRHMRGSSRALHGDKREDVRIRTGTGVLLAAGGREPIAVEIENLSNGGCCLSRVPEDWHLHEPTPIALRLPDNALLLRTQGRIAWRQGTSLGIAFTGISRSHGQQVDQALKRLLEAPSGV
jgi:CRP-like cAMP-binding protein